jgi:ABC-type phosphate/phosphonate transport system substrate-binding protein
MLLSQTCGYPLRTELGDTVRVLAAPAFDLPGCEGVLHTSMLLVPEDGARSLEALGGKVAAVNQPHSNSGMNALRHTFAPLSRAGRFFGEVRLSGGHMASMAMLQRGEADVATIDCVTYGLAALHAPERVQGLRILQQTPALPGLPFIASPRLDDAQAAQLQQVLLGLPHSQPAACATLRLTALQPAHYADYAAVLRLRDEAIAAAYPAVA